MDEPARRKRNTDRVQECFPAFGARVRGVLDALESQGFRPRIQDAWRSPENQLAAFNSGHSKTKFGFHNVTGAAGVKEALACDVLDDDRPLAPTTRYLLALARAARGQGLETGILWGVPADLATGVEAALASGSLDAPVKVGWDPTHVQVTGMATSAARTGARPSFKPGQAPATAGATGSAQTPTAGGGPGHHVVQSRDTLSSIAKANGLTLARILELNPQYVPNPNLIRPGEKVLLR